MQSPHFLAKLNRDRQFTCESSKGQSEGSW
jgi:hypothetical protein